ncbi:MAG: insulinase family protein [Alphaproteobacteria bacterium]|nr:insulinase family protein [Alphaproteobacteria bacterium]
MTTVFTLPNGIRCIHEPRPGSQQVVVRMAIHTGSSHETAADSGLTYLTQEAINGGSKTLGRDDIVEIFENRASHLLTTSDDDEITFGFDSFKDDVGFLFPVMADVLLNPAYDPDEIEWTKTQIKDQLKKRKQNPGAVVGQMFRETVFAGQGAGLPVQGTEATLQTFTPDQLRAKHAEIFSHTSDIVISIGGDIDLDTMKDLVSKSFGQLPAGPARPRPSLTLTEGDVRVAKDLEHLNLIFGFEAPDYNNPERMRYLMLKELLAGGMSSPLFQEIREKRSLVYSVGASQTAKEGTGYFVISAGTGKGNARLLIEESLNLFGKYARDGFTPAQIEKAKDSIMRRQKASEESLAAVVEINAATVMMRNRLVPDSEIEARLNDITNDDLRHACADLMKSGRYVLAGYGPQDAMPAPDEIKAMMARQVQGLVLPPKRPGRDPLAATFQTAAQTQSSVSSADPQMTVLDNGLKVISIEKPGLVTTGIWVNVGSGHETDHLSGATHMIEHMMFKGTPNYPSGTIDKIVEQELGGKLNANTSQTRTAYFFYNLLPEHLDQATSMLGEMVFDANIADAEYAGGTTIDTSGQTVTIEGERNVVLEEIKMYDGQVGSRHNDLQSALNYPNQPMGRPILGTSNSLNNISAAELRAYRDQYYVPNNAIFVVAGPIKHDDVVAAVQARLGHKKASPVPAAAIPAFHSGVSHAEMETAQVATMGISLDGVGCRDQHAIAYDLLSDILSTGHSSRLHREVVLNQKLTTNIGSYAYMQNESGTFSFHTQAEPQNIRDIIKATYEVLAEVAAKGVTPAELDKVKTASKAILLKRTETNNRTCMWFGNYVAATGKLDTIADNHTNIDAVTMDDIQRIALKLLNQAPSLSSILPSGTDPSLIPDITELTAIRDRARNAVFPAPVPVPAAPQTGGPAPGP